MGRYSDTLIGMVGSAMGLNCRGERCLDILSMKSSQSIGNGAGIVLLITHMGKEFG
jgi:hypothetical protein